MMKKLFWFMAGVGLLAALLGNFVFSAPIIPDVLGERLDEWYGELLATMIVLGGLAGGGGAALAQRRLRHLPNEGAYNFLSRVATFGVWTMVWTVVLAIALFFYRSATATFIPLAIFNRFVALADLGKLGGVLGAAAAAAAAGYATVTRIVNWGGRYALLPPPSAPGRSVKHGGA
ncbi:MAG TPA: hypothetical protein VF006_27070 [Longimicrobium sp.]